MADCYDIEAAIDARLDNIATQYREAPQFLHLIRTYAREAGQITEALCSLPSFFDLDTAVGEQLTFIGRRMGWGRCHCVCNITPVFGFECEGVPSENLLGGFCDEAVTWEDCGPFGSSELCINDDEVYRSFLKVRRYQFLALYDLESLTQAVRTFWGDTAMVLDAGYGRVVIAPGRPLEAHENLLLQLYPRVLPIAPGLRVRFHFGDIRVFGFGEGWGEFCEDAVEHNLQTGELEELITEGSVEISTGPQGTDAEWMCEIDVKPYDCAA